ncbi:MAG: SMC-Scp complex subunit ScpB [Candidatus Omnitrophica bacterium]|nr:SMC-Scp complex subunit ScpB [Candidatus Omnitrophota bacterium]
MDIKKIKNIIEALLIVSEKGLSFEEIKNAMSEIDAKEIKKAIVVLKEEYDSQDRAFTIAGIAEKYRIVTKPKYLQWINNLYKKETEKLTGPSLETLAIIAYKQPVTRVEVESVRGVNVGGVIKTLLDKGLIRIKGRRDVIGRPLVYGTTEKFLEIFGLSSVNDLPVLKEFNKEDLKYGKPQEAILIEREEDRAEDREVEGPDGSINECIEEMRGRYEG